MDEEVQKVLLEAVEGIGDAEKVVTQRRLELFELIRRQHAAGVSASALARATGYSRTRIRQILEEKG